MRRTASAQHSFDLLASIRFEAVIDGIAAFVEASTDPVSAKLTLTERPDCTAA